MANEKITVLCAVAADFEGPGGMKYSIGRKDLNIILEAPAWIEKTLMFKWLAADGSLKAVTSANRVLAENSPTVGMGADGKPVLPEETPKAARKGRQKASAKKDDSKVIEAAEAAPAAKKEGEDAE